MIIAQISDTHLIVDGDGSAQRIADFEAVVADINMLDPAPDAIVHTGDIVHNGLPEEYAAAARILGRAKAPVHVLPGNKDNRANLAAAFPVILPALPDGAFLSYEVDDHPLRLLMLDTVNPDSKKGDFCAARFALLERLAATGGPKPVAVFMHHPPFEVLVGPERFHYDDLDLMARLASMIESIGDVRGVFCGHVHRPTTGRVGQVPAVVMTSVATQLRYGDYPEEMAGKPTYLVHRFQTDGSFQTTMRIAGDAS